MNWNLLGYKFPRHSKHELLAASRRVWNPCSNISLIVNSNRYNVIPNMNYLLSRKEFGIHALYTTSKIILVAFVVLQDTYFDVLQNHYRSHLDKD